MRHVPRWLAVVAGLLVAGGLAAACGQIRVVERAQIPFTATTMSVGSVIERGTWLEVKLLSPERNRLFYFLADHVCRAVLEEGAQVDHHYTGGYGYVEQEGIECDVAGIAHLRQYRGSRARRGTAASRARPRARANYRRFWSDEEVVMLRGDFPLASWLAWPRADDTIAVFKREERCMRTFERGSAFIEFNPNGPWPLTLVQPGGGCPLVGLIRPHAGEE
jgi:hypothetical protein